MIEELVNIATAALHTSNARVMLKKVVKRVERRGGLSREQNLSWLQSNSQDFAAMARGIDADLWRESQQFGLELKSRAMAVLSGLGVDLGGGGFYPMLYFVTRYLKPDCIVETGVAAGYSSQAFLTAIKQNGKGRLHSSDFPLFRLRRPEQFIGILVEEPLKAYWDLHINGDEANLPLILSSSPTSGCVSLRLRQELFRTRPCDVAGQQENEPAGACHHGRYSGQLVLL